MPDPMNRRMIDRNGAAYVIGFDPAEPWTDTTTVMTKTLYYRDTATNSDKVYVATIEWGASGNLVIFSWGRCGAALQSKAFGPMSESDAKRLFDEKLAEKQAKGYRDRLDEAGERLASKKALENVTSLKALNAIADRLAKKVTKEMFGMGDFGGGASIQSPFTYRRQDSVDDLFPDSGQLGKAKAEPEPEIESKTGRLIILDD